MKERSGLHHSTRGVPISDLDSVLMLFGPCLRFSLKLLPPRDDESMSNFGFFCWSFWDATQLINFFSVSKVWNSECQIDEIHIIICFHSPWSEVVDSTGQVCSSVNACSSQLNGDDPGCLPAEARSTSQNRPWETCQSSFLPHHVSMMTCF
jgi:hypothetical protein